MFLRMKKCSAHKKKKFCSPGEVLHEVQRQRRRAGLRGLRALLRAGAGRAGVQLGLEHALPRAHADARALQRRRRGRTWAQKSITHRQGYSFGRLGNVRPG